MANFIDKLYEYLLIKLSSITIKQVYVFTMFFILIFTVIFSYLLIEENYSDYERTLYENAHMSVQEGNETTLDKHDEREKKLKTLLIKNTLAIATLAFILFAITLGLFKIFHMLIQRDMEVFLEFFKNGAHSQEALNPRLIFFQEFKKMVTYANQMVGTINEQKTTLTELNISLEDKVKEKTKDLQVINENLIKEKKFSEEILDAQKEFLRHTVHETNTPLSVMLTSIELYVMNHPKDRQLSKIEAAAKNIFNIYDDLSYLVKKDQVVYPKMAINLKEYLGSRVDFFKEVAELSKVALEYVYDESKIHIYFNDTKLQRILDNTITNAIKYTLPHEVIEIRLESIGLYADISVSSKSKEIQDKEKIFNPFYREESKKEGFGIGLRLVKTICDEESVTISIESNKEKTTFKYRFKVMGE